LSSDVKEVKARTEELEGGLDRLDNNLARVALFVLGSAINTALVAASLDAKPNSCHLEIVGWSVKVLFPLMIANFIAAFTIASGLSLEGQFWKL
jgi:hypothetical protein